MRKTGVPLVFKIFCIVSLSFLVFALFYFIDTSNSIEVPLSPPENGLSEISSPKSTDEPTVEDQSENRVKLLQDDIKPGASIDPNHHFFQGRVVKKEGQSPIRSFSIIVYRQLLQHRKTGWGPWSVTRKFEDEEGWFTLSCSVNPAYRYRLTVSARGFRKGFSESLEAAPGSRTNGIRIALEPLPLLVGTVLNAEGQHYVEKVKVYSITDYKSGVSSDEDFRSVPHAETDHAGNFSLPLQAAQKHLIVAHHPDYSEAVVSDIDPALPLRIYLHTGFQIKGKAHDPKGEPVKKGLILVRADRGPNLPPLEQAVLTEEDGTFSTGKLHSGNYSLWLKKVPGFPEASSLYGKEKVSIINSDVTDIMLGGHPENGALHGRLHSGSEPVAGARIVFEDLKTETDLNGEFQLHGLDPGLLSLKVVLTGDLDSEKGNTFPVEIVAGFPIHMGFSLGQHTVEGSLIDSKTRKQIKGSGNTCYLYHVRNHGRNYYKNIAIDSDGTFTIPYLDEADYELVFSAGGYALEAVPVFRKEIKSGITGLEIKMRPGGTVLASVHSNAPLTCKEIEFRIFLHDFLSVGMKASDLKRDIAGRFIIDRADWNGIRLACKCYGKFEEQGVSVPVRKPGYAQFFFQAPFEVNGRVTADYLPLANARVCLSYRRMSRLENANSAWEASLPCTDANGCFSLSIKDPGQYYIGLYSPCGDRISLLDQDSVLISEAPYWLDLKAGVYCYRGRLIDAWSGDPVTGACVVLVVNEKKYRRTTDLNGCFVFKNMIHKEAEIKVYAPGYIASPFEFDFGLDLDSDKEQVFALGGKGGKLCLVLAGQWFGNNWDRFSDCVKIGENSYPLSRFSKEAGKNRFHIDGVPAGTQKIEVSLKRYRRFHRGEATVEITEGETTEAVIHVK